MRFMQRWHLYRAASIARTIERLGHERAFHEREARRCARSPFQGRAVRMIETRGCMGEQDHKTMYGVVKEVFAPRKFSSEYFLTIRMQDGSEHKVYAHNFFEASDGALEYRY